jgi:hypothetical protein
VADFRINVTAETQAAERKLQAVDKAANEATRKRTLNIDVSQLGRDFGNIEKNIKEAGNTIQTFYRVSKNVPGIGDKVQQYENLAKGVAETAKNAPASAAALRENAKAGSILANSFELAGSKASGLVTNLAQIGFATFAVKQAVGVLQAAFGGFFNETIGREIKLRETILKTQTTLASTNKVFRGGKEITDPYQKIVALSGEVGKRIDSIRERSIALAGVTSGEVIEVFGIVASQVGQIGGGLKEAEDLAINFAAALGTFGIPLYQARQEIGSILRADITTDSYLAKALGITNEDVTRAKSQAGGVVKFLEDRLSAAVAGQKIAAQGFSGVVSNLKDITELVGQAFGRGLLDPLLTGLTQIFETLFRIRGTLFDIAEGAGRTIGRVSTTVIGLTAGRTGAGKGVDTDKLVNNAKDVAQEAFSAIEGIAQRTVGAIALAFTTLKPSILVIADAFRVLTKAFLEIKAGTFEALASAVANLVVVLEPAVTVFAGLFNVYARFLDLPGVQYIAELAAVLGLLKRAGLDAATNIALLGRFIVSSVVPAIGALGTFMGALVAGIGAAIIAIGQLTLALAGLATALITPFNAIPAIGAALKDLAGNLTSVAGNTTKAGGSVKDAASSLQVLGSSAKAAGMSIVTSLGWVFLIQVGIAAIVDAFGKYQRAQEEASRTGKAMQALHELSTTYKNVADNADSATKAAVAFRKGLVDTEYNRTIERLEEISSKLNDLEYEARAGIQTWGEFARVLGDFANGDIDPLGGNKDAARLLAEEVKLREAKRKIEAARDKDTIAENLSLEADKRVNLEKEIADLRKQQEDQIFQLRQQQAQKEVEIFRAAGELRIFQMEQANAKLIEGEEGASAAALDALNNYLSTRERGELDIESAKQQMVIEATNLERQIADYRLENEKKIAEIRKRAGDYEQRVAQYRNQQAQQRPIAPGASTGFLVGNTGRSSGPHLDLRSPTGDKQAVINEAVAIIKAWQQQNLAYIELSNARIDVKNMTDEGKLRQALAKEQQVHGRRSGGGAIDIAVPAGTLVPTPVGTPSWGGDGGWQATSLQTGNLFLHGLENSTATPKGQAAPITPPQAPSFADIGTPAVENYAAAVRSLSGAMERLRTLQAALTEAKTAAAFEAIAKAAFPKVALEQYDDQLKEAKFTLEAIAAATEDAYNPERLKIAVDEKTKIAIQESEIQEIYAKAVEQRNQGNVTEAELQKLKEKLLKDQKEYVSKLAKEKQLRQEVLQLTTAQEAIQSSMGRTRALTEGTQDIQTRARLELEGVRRELIDAELKKAQLQRDLNEALKNAGDDPTRTADLRSRFATEAAAIDAQAQAQIAANDPVKQLIGKWRTELDDTRASVASLAQSIQTELGSAMSSAVSGVITGTTTVQEAFGQMFQNIAKTFMDMATQMIAKMIVMYVLDNLLGGLLGGGSKGLGSIGGGGGFGSWSGGNSFSSGGIPELPGLGSTGALATKGLYSGIKFRATGGPVTARTPYIVGERGPELFVPGANGSIVPNHAMGSDKTVVNGGINITVQNTGESLGAEAQKQIARQVQGIVMGTLMNERRSGGILR